MKIFRKKFSWTEIFSPSLQENEASRDKSSPYGNLIFKISHFYFVRISKSELSAVFLEIAPEMALSPNAALW
jgi:hypothetical protein